MSQVIVRPPSPPAMTSALVSSDTDSMTKTGSDQACLEAVFSVVGEEFSVFMGICFR